MEMARDWDMKAPRSRAELEKDIAAEAKAKRRPPPKFNPNKKIDGEYDTVTTIDSIKEQVAGKEDVILDTSRMEPGQVSDLKSAVTAEGLDKHVIYYP
jgi:hypothetical protein